ncbi:MAG: hypothetical protein IJN97_01030, partial [Oscillospiraceae bacterium]|nr:hypothetical protein [Oscillospiraceae bacterium]
MNKVTGLRFYVNEDFNLVVEDGCGDTVKYKVISLNTFCRLIDNSAKLKDIETGLLPERCIAFRESEDGARFIALELGREN